LVVESAARAIRPTPVPAPKSAPAGSGDEEAAALLLSVQDDGDSSPSTNVDSEGVPTGTTIMELPTPGKETPLPGAEKVDKAEAAKQAAGNTSSAAKAILEKYLRRPRR